MGECSGGQTKQFFLNVSTTPFYFIKYGRDEFRTLFSNQSFFFFEFFYKVILSLIFFFFFPHYTLYIIICTFLIKYILYIF